MNRLPTPDPFDLLSSIVNHTLDIPDQSPKESGQLLEAEISDASIFSLLRGLEIIDSEHSLAISRSLPHPPPVQYEQFAAVNAVLDQPIFNSSVSLKTILRHILSFNHEWVSSIDIVGGFVRKLILESPEYLSMALGDLTGLNDEVIQPYVDQITGRERQNPLVDIDIRIHTSLESESDLKNFTQHVANSLGYYFHHAEERVPKIDAAFDDHSRCCTITFQGEAKLTYKLQFLPRLNCPHLFSIDSLALPLLPFLLEKPPIDLERTIENGWQPLVYLLTRSIEIVDPETAGPSGFHRLLSYLIQDYAPLNMDGIRALEKRTFKELEQDPLDSLRAILSGHPLNEPSTAVILTATCCFLLNRSEAEKFELYALMREGYWGEDDLDNPFLEMIDRALFEENIPFSVLSAALAFFAFCGNMAGKGLPIGNSPYALYLPLSLEEALDELDNFLKLQPLPESIFNLIFDPGSAILSAEHFGPQFDMAMECAQSKSRKLRFLGYALLIPFERHPSAYSLLLKNYIDVLNFIPDHLRSKFSSFLEKKFGPSSPFADFNRMDKAEASEQLKVWVRILLGNPETSQTAYCVWLAYRKKYDRSERHAIDAQLMLALLPEYPENSLQLFERMQGGSIRPKDELLLLQSILQWAVQQQPLKFTLFSEQIAAIISRELVKPDSKHPKQIIPPAFPAALAEYISRLIEEERPDLAYTLLMASKHLELPSTDPHLYECWLKLSDNPNYPIMLWVRNWDEISLLGPCPSELTDAYQRTHFIFIERLFQNSEGSKEGFKQLRLYAETAHANERFAELAQRDIQQLVEADQMDSALEIFENLYQKHFQTEVQQAVRKQLFDQFLQLNSPAQAYALWKEIRSDYPEATEALLQSLVQEKAYKKKAYQSILAELKNVYLSPDECFEFYLKVYHRDPSQKVLAKVVEHCFKNNLSEEHQLSAIVLVKSELNGPVSSVLKKAVSSYTNRMLELLLANEDYRQIDQLVELLIDLQIDAAAADCFPLLSQKLSFYFQQLNDVSKLVQWMRHALKDPDLSTEWLPELLYLCENLKPADEALIYLELMPQINEALRGKSCCGRAWALVKTGEIGCELAIQLLNHYPPIESSPWDSLLSLENEGQFEKIWNAYYTWLSQNPEMNEGLFDTTISMISHFSHLASKPEPELIDSLNSPDTPLGRLAFQCEGEALSLHKHLLLSLAGRIQRADEFVPLYNEWFNEEGQAVRHQGFILKLIEGLADKSDKQLLLFCLEKFYLLVKENRDWIEEDSSHEIHAALLNILKRIDCDTLIESPSLMRILKLLLDFNLSENQRLSLADALGSFDSPEILDAAISFLSLNRSSPSQEVWQTILPKYLKLKFDLSLPRDRVRFIAFYFRHINYIDKNSSAYAQCVEQLFALALEELYNGRGILHFNQFLPHIFQSFFENAIPYELTWEEVFKNAYCPVLSINKESSENDRMEFFRHLSSLLSIMMDRDPVAETIEEFIRIFIFKNLEELCAYSPNEHNCLVELLDRFYFRYSPSIKHIEMSNELFLEAQQSCLYIEHHEKMKESMMYLQFQTCTRKNVEESARDQNEILEQVIDRTLDFGTPSSVLRAVLIMQGVQLHILEGNHETLLRIYQKIIDSIHIDPFFTHEKKTLFEWVRIVMMQSKSIFGSSSDREDKKTATQLAELLFEKVYEISQQFDPSDEASRKFYIHLLTWLEEYLLLLPAFGVYRDRKGTELYFARVQLILSDFVGIYPLLNDFQRECTRGIIPLLIVGDGFGPNQGFSKKLKQLRCRLMNQWFIAISSSPECVEKTLEICTDNKIYEGNRKEYRKMLQEIDKSAKK